MLDFGGVYSLVVIGITITLKNASITSVIVVLVSIDNIHESIGI